MGNSVNDRSRRANQGANLAKTTRGLLPDLDDGRTLKLRKLIDLMDAGAHDVVACMSIFGRYRTVLCGAMPSQAAT